MGIPVDRDADQATLSSALARIDLAAPEMRAALDRLARLAAQWLRVPVSTISIVEPDRQRLPGAIGLDEPWATTRETPLSYSFCRYVVSSGMPLVIEDATRDPLVRESPAIRELQVIAYLGVPLVAPNGSVVGSLCAIDHHPRAWTDADQALLTDLCASAASEIALRVALRDLTDAFERERRWAIELNDELVQQLAAAKLQLQLDHVDAAIIAHVATGLASAQATASAMLERSGGLRSGGVRRDVPRR